ncbi:MAG: endo-1,4-beta-xylanase [Treponema sp.]|nr:endo-1,4-beta-xylanase [Treponema sp.]
MNKNKVTILASILMLCSFGLHAAEPITVNRIDEDKKSIKFGQKVDGFKDVTVIKGKACTKQNPISVDLSSLANQEVAITLSGDLKITGTDATYDIIWMINDFEAGFPELSRQAVKTNEWTHFSGRTTVILGSNKQLYLSKAGIPMDDVTFYIKNLSVKMETEGTLGSKVSWMDAPSLKKAFEPYFRFGMAVTYKGELTDVDIQDGLYRHVDTITLGNAFKPDFLFAWQNPTTKLTQYTDNTGKTIEVPALLPKFNDMDAILGLAKMNNLQIRGHVLTWHSQTPHWFFTEGYSNSKDAPYVDRETMTARHEWYIKSVLEHVTQWEEKNNNGKHIVWAWDVVNEAALDGASESRWLREDSDWYRIYKDETFIVNAFRFANKYAPSDVLLCYNDYGTSSGSNLEKGGKMNACLKIIDAIQAAPDARIDVMGMQSHISMSGPKATGNDSFETAVQKYAAKGIDIHVTELDIGHQMKYSPFKMKERYNEMFTMFIENRKTEKKHGISCVTLWGITDEATWLDGQKEYQGNKQHPLLFEGRDLYCKPAFYGVLEAAESAKQ